MSIPICAGCADELRVPRDVPSPGHLPVKHRLTRCKLCGALTWAGIRVEQVPDTPAADAIRKRFGGLL